MYEKSIILFTCGCIYDCGNCLEHNSQDNFSLMVCLGCFVMAWWFSAQQRKSMGLFGLLPAIHLLYMSTQSTGQVINIEMPLGIITALHVLACGFCVWKKGSNN